MRKWSHKSILGLIAESGNENPEEEIRARARELVLKALDNGWTGPPFNSIELSKHLGLRIEPNDNILDARIIPVGKNKFHIEYNPFQKPTRINFSVAHEIAHTLFSDCNQEIRNREDKPLLNRELEQLCNIGASEIQLPYAVFSNDANNIENITLENLIGLATKYKASLESLFLRFVEVIDRPCAVLICSFTNSNSLDLEYYKASKQFRLALPKNFSVPQDSKAYECTAPGWSSRESVQWEFLDGNYGIYCIGLSPLRGDNRGRVGIIISPLKNPDSITEGKIIMEFGDATKPRGSGNKVIAQIVNSSGALGFGFGKALATNYPIVKTALKEWQTNTKDFVLGNSNLVKVEDQLYVFQMLAQKGLHERSGEIPLKYSSLRKCLIDLGERCNELNASVHMPLIGAGQAKGDWNIIQGMIHDELVSNEIKVSVYMLPGKIPNLKTKQSLTLFDDSTTWGNRK